VHNLAVIGAVSFVLFAVATISQALSARLPTRRPVSLGLPMLLAALEGSLFTRALGLFLADTVVGGIAIGVVFRGGLSEVSRLAEPGRRAEAISAFFAAAYLGLGLPVVQTGLLLRADQYR
jgi:predicted MFS family arabinose efflux permease